MCGLYKGRTQAVTTATVACEREYLSAVFGHDGFFLEHETAAAWQLMCTGKQLCLIPFDCSRDRWQLTAYSQPFNWYMNSVVFAISSAAGESVLAT